MKDDERENAERAGMRLVEIWVPDLNDPAIAAEMRRQSLLASESDEEDSEL